MGTTYTRQSSFSDGDTITAALFNDEYNQLLNAFAYASSGTTGHQHDGTAAEGGNIHTIGDQDFLNKIVADSTNNRWGVFVEVSSAAVEQIRIQDGAIVPVTDNDVDLGTSSLEFKDAYFDGTVTTDGLTVSGTTNLDGAIQVDNTITVGVDDTGYDVKFFGDTASAYMLWDTSADDLVLAGAAGIDLAGDIDVDGTANLDNTDIDGTLAVDGATISLDATTSLNIDNSNTSNGITIGTATSDVPISIGHSTSEVTVNDNLTVTGTLTLGSGAELAEAELEMLDGITAGTVAASKAVVVDSNKDAASFRNITLTGVLDAATLDISGDADIDGTLEADAITVDGTTLAEYISDTTGAMFSSNTESGITVTYQDGDNTVDLAVDAAQTGITSIYATDLIMGEDSQTAIDFGTANEIDFKVDNAARLTLTASALYPVTDNQIDLGTSSLEFKDAYFDGTVTADAFAGPLTGDVTGTSSKVTVTDSTANTNFPVVFNDESDGLLDDTGALRYNPSTGQLLVPNLTVAGTTTQVDTVTMNAQNAVIFEGATADAHETTLSVVDPTGDHTQYLINQGGYIPLLAAATTTTITSTPAELNILDGATVVVGEVNALDLGATAVGTAIASKAVILDSNKDYTGVRNFTITGELDGATLDISGDADIDGTTNLDVVDIDGAVDMATTLTLAGNADFNGDLDVDGTTNLDVVDIDGAVDMASTLGVTGIATFSGTVVGNAANFDIKQNTSDGSDDRRTRIGGGGDVSHSRGAFIELTGNNHSDTGSLTLNAGDVSGGDIVFKTDNTARVTIDDAGGMLITTADNSDTLSLVSTDADGGSGPNLRMYRNSGSPADGDAIGLMDFEGRNDNSQDVVYAAIDTRIVDASDGAEDGRIELATILAGTAGTSRMLMDATETVFNDNSKDLDFRVESDNLTNALFVQGSDGAVTVGATLGVTGALSKGSGTFRIPHGLRENYDLCHSFIEGPQCDLIYRGRVDLVNGRATVSMDTKYGMTAGTFEWLTRDVQTFTSNETGWDAVKSSFSGDTITIECQNTASTDTISWMVVAERGDPNIKASDITDSNGDLIIERAS